MSDRLEVDTDGLTRLAGDFDSLRDQLGEPSAADQVRADLGSDDVWDAVAHFEARWSDGRRRLDDSFTALSRMLQDCASEFERVDDGLSAGIEGAVSGGPGRPASATG